MAKRKNKGKRRRPDKVLREVKPQESPGVEHREPSSPEKQKPQSALKKVLAVLAVLAAYYQFLTVLGVVLGLIVIALNHLNPIALYVSRGPLDPNDPMSTYFVAENKWVLSLYNLNIGCLERSDRSTAIVEDNYVTHPKYTKAIIQPFEKLDVFCSREFSIPGEIISTDLCIRTTFTYTRWFLEREFFSRFVARKDKAGFFWTQDSASECASRLKEARGF